LALACWRHTSTALDYWLKLIVHSRSHLPRYRRNRGEFATGKVPNVFPMTPEFGTGAADSPCAIRIRDNDNVGFDAVCLEAVHEVRDSPAVNFNDIAMQSGTLNIPIVASVTTVRLESGCNTISNHQFGTKCNNCLLAPGAIHIYQPTCVFLTQILTTSNILRARISGWRTRNA
jgi:hypothetical protein